MPRTFNSADRSHNCEDTSTHSAATRAKITIKMLQTELIEWMHATAVANFPYAKYVKCRIGRMHYRNAKHGQLVTFHVNVKSVGVYLKFSSCSLGSLSNMLERAGLEHRERNERLGIKRVRDLT